MKKSISSSSYSCNRLHNDSTRIDSFPDSTRVAQMNLSQYEDALTQEVFISTAYEHIKEELIVNSRQSMKPLRLSISQLKQSIYTLEHQQQKDLINLEYEISTQIHRLKQKVSQFQILQNGEHTLLQEQLSKLQYDDQEIIQDIEAVDFRIKNITPQIGQYTYQFYE